MYITWKYQVPILCMWKLKKKKNSLYIIMYISHERCHRYSHIYQSIFDVDKKKNNMTATYNALLWLKLEHTCFRVTTYEFYDTCKSICRLVYCFFPFMSLTFQFVCVFLTIYYYYIYIQFGLLYYFLQYIFFSLLLFILFLSH